MTALEWFAGEIKGGQLITNQKFKELLEQAKEMEKKQISDAWVNGGSTLSAKNAEQYYNETFKLE